MRPSPFILMSIAALALSGCDEGAPLTPEDTRGRHATTSEVDGMEIEDRGVFVGVAEGGETGEFSGVIRSTDPDAVRRALRAAGIPITTVGYEGERLAAGEGEAQLFIGANQVGEDGVYFYVDSASEVSPEFGAGIVEVLRAELAAAGVQVAVIEPASNADRRAAGGYEPS